MCLGCGQACRCPALLALPLQLITGILQHKKQCCDPDGVCIIGSLCASLLASAVQAGTPRWPQLLALLTSTALTCLHCFSVFLVCAATCRCIMPYSQLAPSAKGVQVLLQSAVA